MILYHPLEMIKEWRKGCSVSDCDRPERCEQCTRALIDCIELYLTSERNTNGFKDIQPALPPTSSDKSPS